MSALQTSLNSTPTPSDFIATSAAVAAQTVRYAVIAVIVAAICIMVYIAWAFREMPGLSAGAFVLSSLCSMTSWW